MTFSRLKKTFSFFAIFILLASTVYGAFECAPMPFDTHQFLETVDDHVHSLREKNLRKAYFKYTSPAFQEETSLGEFMEIVNKHSPLHENATLQLSGIQFFEELGLYQGIITSSTGEKLAIEYELAIEENGWKIIGFRLLNIVCQEELPTGNNETSS